MQIEYSIQYSNRKTLSIIVERDRRVVVRAPLNTSKELIEKEISKRKYSLFQKINHPQKYENPKPRKEFVSGESILFLGTHYKLEVVQDEIEGILFDNKFYIKNANRTKAEQLFRIWYFNQAVDRIIPRVKYYAKNMGVSCKSIKIVDLKYRWGSCSPKDNINFNWRLIKAPIFVIDYIIVHELTHLIQPNHTPEFWNILSIQIPSYEKAKEWLKRNGAILEDEF